MSRLTDVGPGLSGTSYEFPTSVTGAPAIVTTPVRGGAYAIEITPTAAEWMRVQYHTPNTQDVIFYRGYLRVKTAPTGAAIPVFGGFHGGDANYLVGIRLTSGLLLQLFNQEDGIQIGSNSSAISLDTWYRIEWKIDTTTLASTFCEAKAYADTQGASAFWNPTGTVNLVNSPDQLMVGSTSADATADFFVCDLAVNNDAGSFENTWCGEAKGERYLRPNATGSYSQWTPLSGENWNSVEEDPPDDATSYVASNTAGQRDDYELTDTPSGIASDDVINCVLVGSRFRDSAATGADPSYVLRIKVGASGTVEETTDILADVSAVWSTIDTGGTKTYKLVLYDLPGASTTAWTKADLDTTQIGVRESVSDTHFVWVTAVWLIVDYKAASTPPTIISISDTGIGSDIDPQLSASISINEISTGIDLFQYPDIFPSTPLIDNFNRETLGPNWTVITGFPNLDNNRLRATGTINLNIEWNQEKFGPAVEFYMTVGGLTNTSIGLSGTAYLYYNYLGSPSYELYGGNLSSSGCSLVLFKTPGSIRCADSGYLSFSSRDTIGIGVRHLGNGEISLYLDRGNGQEKVASGNNSSILSSTGTTRLIIDYHHSWLWYDDLGGDTLGISTISAFDSLVDIGIGDDALNLLASLSVFDSGFSLDEISILISVMKSLSDAGFGSDQITNILASLLTDESGSGIDNPQLAASLGITDGALGGDFLDLSALLSLSDVGTGSDAISVLSEIIKSISDSGLGSDQVNISVSLSVQDTGTGADAVIISATISVLDTGTGIDLETVSKISEIIKSISDNASGSDRLTISASLNVGELSYGIDDPAIQAALGLIDSGGGLESPQISAQLTIIDISSATDIISILQAILKTVQDAGSGLDAISQISASIPVSEIGIGTDQIGQLLASLLVTDFGEGIDVIVKFDSTSNILRITFELRKPKIVATLAQPTISIELLKPMIKFLLNSQ